MSEYVEPELNLEALENKQGRKFTNFKIVDGINIYRILPAFGANNGGRINSEVWLHWGFTDAAGRIRPLQCSLRGPEKFCPICDEAGKLFKEKELLVAPYTDKTEKGPRTRWEMVPEDIKTRYEEVKKRWDAIKGQRNYLYNAMAQDNTVGVLKLTAKTAHDELSAKIVDCVKKRNFNPTSLNQGCFFVISRQKTGSKPTDVKYSVDLLKSEVQTDEGVAEMVKKGPVPESVKSNYANLAVDIHTLYPTRTAAELQKIMLGDTTLFDRKSAEMVQQPIQTGTTGFITQVPAVVQPVKATIANTTITHTATPTVAVTVASTPSSDRMEEMKRALGLA